MSVYLTGPMKFAEGELFNNNKPVIQLHRHRGGSGLWSSICGIFRENRPSWEIMHITTCFKKDELVTIPAHDDHARFSRPPLPWSQFLAEQGILHPLYEDASKVENQWADEIAMTREAVPIFQWRRIQDESVKKQPWRILLSSTNTHVLLVQSQTFNWESINKPGWNDEKGRLALFGDQAHWSPHCVLEDLFWNFGPLQYRGPMIEQYCSLREQSWAKAA